MTVQDQTAVDVAIIGAGPAGLTAAYLLTKKGYSVTVIEKDERYVGGISRTVEVDGYRFDIGGHRFFSKSKDVVDLWNEILPNDFIQRPRMSRIYYEGKFYSYPLRAFEALVRDVGTVLPAGVESAESAATAAARVFHEPSKDGDHGPSEPQSSQNTRPLTVET